MKASSFSKALPFVLFSTAPFTQAQSVVLTDDMTDTFYSDFSFNGANSGSNPDDVSIAFWGNDSTGGNPGAVFNLFHEHDVDRDENGDPFGDTVTNIQSFFDNNSLSYTPSTQGAIQSITFSLDVKTSDPIDSVFFSINDSNGGSLANGGAGFLTIVPNGQWQTVTLSGVTQAGATARDFAGSEPLTFGFGFSSFIDVFPGPETLTLQADNLQIEITPIPEPSSVLLLSLASFALVRRRR